MPASQPDTFYLQFNEDSSIEDNIYIIPAYFTKYRSINDSSTTFSNATVDGFNYHYTINNNYLILTGGCYEQCGLKFSKIN